MQEKRYQELYRELIGRLTEKQFLKKVKLSKKAMLELIDSSGSWKTGMKTVLSGEQVSCEAVLTFCRPVLSLLAAEPEEGWLPYISRIVQSQMFPAESPAAPGEPSGRTPENAHETGRLFYLEVFRCFLEWERQTVPFDPCLHLELLTEEEVQGADAAAEYERLLERIRRQYLYEFMRMGSEITSYNTLAHIAGVHFIAMHVGRQLLAAGVPVDLALVSGVAFGHDIGKYGCKPEEAKRVPYLHYYYTDKYFKENGMPSIGHIAANHSTWDLELENLSVESLVLIYADFRVKSVRNGEGKEAAKFFSLKDSFQVILDKLDNVDDAKRERYIRVYAKLKDFEDYMEGLGINTDLTSRTVTPPEKKDVSLYDPEEAVRSLKHLAIRHNIFVMHKFNNEASFSDLIEKARSQKNWKSIRAYLNILQEYFTYMTQKQKLITLNFLYELLMHREGDIRRQSAGLIAQIIVNYDVEYRKELPEGVTNVTEEVTGLAIWEKYLDLIILPDHKVTEQHRRWLGFILKLIVSYVLEHCREEDSRRYLDGFLKYYTMEAQSESMAFVLLDSIASLPMKLCTDGDKRMLVRFAHGMAGKESVEIRVAVLRFLNHLAQDEESRRACQSMILDCLEEITSWEETGVRFLRYKIMTGLGRDEQGEYERDLQRLLRSEPPVSSELFLQNLKAATPWIIKIENLELLLYQLESEPGSHLLQVAAHLSNLIKVSERITLRHQAGAALLAIAPMLTLTQRNEIAVELSKGLEIGEYEFSKYIPEYLGALAMYLHPQELDELILDFKKMLYSTNDRICSVTLDTLGVMLQNYAAYQERFGESDAQIGKRRQVILGLILKGLSDYRETVSQEALLVIGQYLFGSPRLSFDEKYEIFAVIYKKMLTLITGQRESDLSFFNSAATLNHVYRFILEYLFRHKAFAPPLVRDVAFFPGSFDPFSLGHKEIAKEIRDLGFEVYLAVDDFFWSKKTQPKMIRRKIVSMSIADEPDIFLFPDEIPVNIASPSDLKRLRELFPGRRVHIAAGSDVTEKASAYLAPPSEGSVHGFPHIVFSRGEVPEKAEKAGKKSPAVGPSAGKGKEEFQRISGGVRPLVLPPGLQEISSTKIRENIDSNRDISNLIDPLVQSYIYENSLYLREPLFKYVFSANRIHFQMVEEFTGALGEEVAETLFRSQENKEGVIAHLLRPGTKGVILREGGADSPPAGMVTFHETGMADLYHEFGSIEVASRVRSITSGKVVVLSGIASEKKAAVKNISQLILTEVLADCLKNEFTYGIFHNRLGNTDPELADLLERQGFVPVYQDGAEILYGVDMKFPVTLFSDIEVSVKEPLKQRPKVLAVIEEAHRRMQRAMVKLYPGNLVLNVDSGLMNHRIVDMITRESQIPYEPLSPGALGKYMCVPFGKILRGMTIPNIVTKSLQTEKRFEPEIDEFQITEYPYYSPLINQIRMIKSFRRPVLLVDDLLHKGYRMQKLDPLLKEEGIDVRKLIVGILSGRGKDLMAVQKRQVDSVYFIPNLRSWFVESSLYPFLGGDGIHRGDLSNAGFIPSVNLILPYVAPRFMADVSPRAIYDFSMTCLENARDILAVLEEEYQLIFEKNLTMNRLSEAISSPRYPDKGLSMSYDLNSPPSLYAANDIELLKRLENLIL